MTKDVGAKIEDERSALRFFAAAIEFADTEDEPVVLLLRLESEAGTAAVCKALENMTSIGDNIFHVGFIPLLSKLGDIAKPVYQKQMLKLLLSIYKFRFDISDMIARRCAASGSFSDQATVLAWFYLQVAIASADARSDPNVNVICSEIERISPAAKKLRTVLGGKEIDRTDRTSLAHLQASHDDQPGGRHDNDHADFRDIQTRPTLEQMMSDLDPFLPAAADTTTEPELLDRMFRLYHEDSCSLSRETARAR